MPCVHRPRSILISLICMAAAAQLAGAAEVRSAHPFVGVTHYQIVQKAEGDNGQPRLPRPAVVHLLEIDTKAEGVRLQMSPGNGEVPGEITRGTTRAYVDSIGAQIGINVGFYDTGANYGGLNTDLIHLAASEGEVYSLAGGGEWVFDVSKEGIPRIARADGKNAETIAKGTKVYNAAGGNQPMLRDGSVVTPDDGYTKALNPHTAVGVSRDGRKVFLCVVDGRQAGYSEGLRTDEMAALMRRFGAWDAINLDGGGSTTMVIDDDGDDVADARVLNSPSDNGSPSKPGRERVVANSLAVFAKPRPGYVPLPTPERPKLENPLDLLTAVTILDDFEKDAGRFAGAVTASGSSKGVDAKSTATLDAAFAKNGKQSLKLSIVASGPKDDLLLRLLSGNASPKTNDVEGKAMGNDGYVGVWLRREATDKTPLYVSMVVDEGTPNSVSTERGQPFEVKADGEWHLYQWGLNEDAKWFNYNGGDGRIDGPNVFVDSLLFTTAKPGEKGGGGYSGTVWMDALTYSPAERIK